MQEVEKMIRTAEEFKEGLGIDEGSVDRDLRCTGDGVICCGRGLLFEARTEKQRRSFAEAIETEHLLKVTRVQAHKLLPGISFHPDGSRDDFYGLFLPTGCVLNSRNYMKAIWRACQVTRSRCCCNGDCDELQYIVEDSDGRLGLSLHKDRVLSCTDLNRQHGPLDAIIVAAGAAVDCLTELRGKLPLRLCHVFPFPFPFDGSGIAIRARHLNSALDQLEDQAS